MWQQRRSVDDEESFSTDKGRVKSEVAVMNEPSSTSTNTILWGSVWGARWAGTTLQNGIPWVVRGRQAADISLTGLSVVRTNTELIIKPNEVMRERLKVKASS